VAGEEPSGAKQLCESTKKVRAGGIWERRAQRGGAHQKGEDNGTPTRFHRREGGSGARGRWWVSPAKEGRGCARAWMRESGGEGGHRWCSTLFIGGGCAVTGKGNGGGGGGEGRHVVA
jgi:hypothetical protein